MDEWLVDFDQIEDTDVRDLFVSQSEEFVDHDIVQVLSTKKLAIK